MYETNYALIESEKFNLEEIENMLPWERRVYIGLHIKNIQEQKERMEQVRRKNKIKG